MHIAEIAMKKTTAKFRPKHPPASEMVMAAIVHLKDRKGSSLQAIKKYIATTYNIDPERQSYHICKYLRSATENKTIVRTRGVGAAGSFKIARAENGKPKRAATRRDGKVAKTASEKPTAKKQKGEKKAVIKKTAVEKAAKSPLSKIKKSGKALAAKTTKPKSKKVKRQEKLKN